MSTQFELSIALSFYIKFDGKINDKNTSTIQPNYKNRSVTPNIHFVILWPFDESNQGFIKNLTNNYCYKVGLFVGIVLHLNMFIYNLFLWE